MSKHIVIPFSRDVPGLDIPEIILTSHDTREIDQWIQDNIVTWYNNLENHQKIDHSNEKLLREFCVKFLSSDQDVLLRTNTALFSLAHTLAKHNNVVIHILIQDPYSWITDALMRHSETPESLLAEPDHSVYYTEETSRVYRLCFEWERTYQFVLGLMRAGLPNVKTHVLEETEHKFNSRDTEFIKSICSHTFNKLKAFPNHVRTLKVSDEKYEEDVKAIVASGENYSGDYDSRRKGLDILYDNCEGCSVVDIGSSNGNLSYQFCARGARSVKGFEIDWKKVDFCNKFFQKFETKAEFVQTDLMTVDGFKKFVENLDDEYDITLYMGVHHCLFGNLKPLYNKALELTMETGEDYTEKVLPHVKTHGFSVMDELIDRTKTYFCYRSWAYIVGITKHLERKGFRLVSSTLIPSGLMPGSKTSYGTGKEYTKIFKRIS